MSSLTQTQRSANTQTRLLDATIEELVDRGYARTSTVKICHRAGVSRGAQLHHYPTKISLMAAAVEHLFTRGHNEFRVLLERQSKSKDRVHKALRALWKIYWGPTLRAWMELVIASRTDAELRESVKAVNDRFVVQAEQTYLKIFPKTDPSKVRPKARLLMATLDGLAMNRVLEDNDVLAEEVLALLGQGMRP